MGKRVKKFLEFNEPRGSIFIFYGNWDAYLRSISAKPLSKHRGFDADRKMNHGQLISKESQRILKDKQKQIDKKLKDLDSNF